MRALDLFRGPFVLWECLKVQNLGFDDLLGSVALIAAQIFERQRPRNKVGKL
jgi:hypothetical protein